MPEPPPRPLAPDTVVADRYRVTAPLEDRDAFTLYTAVRVDDARAVTLLVLDARLLGDERLRERFRRLTVSPGPLPGVARVIEVAADEQAAWLAFDPPAGETLASALTRGPRSSRSVRRSRRCTSRAPCTASSRPRTSGTPRASPARR